MTSNRLMPTQAIPTNPRWPKSLPARISLASGRPLRRYVLRTLAIATPEPPWLVPSPPPRSTSNERLELSHYHVKSSSVGRIPISIRLVQLQKKTLARRRRLDDPSSLCAVGGALWSLICLLEELHRSAVSIRDVMDRDRVFWDSTEPLVWLFHRVFSASPNLLALAADFVAESVERCVEETISTVFMRSSVLVTASFLGSPEMGSNGSWADIGILDEPDTEESDPRGVDLRRRRSLYESIIFRDKEPNSLILSNYAQFLYQFEMDHDRAEEYFELSVKTEPVDGKALSRYASFLWHARGDLAAAEERFLEAIEADPTSSYHQSCYAKFLFCTGGDETCFPLVHGIAGVEDADSNFV
ncbi:hypothetical protein HPP92_027601 [Vanilla planifolia]|uniref:Uncharacterized protein n=1 Tax=Vanilla planifolia TaxID=51239 RepID=A0A835P8K2_VANPL|nr:hypothetical protein HPP92_027601 [Vanilla planifolia]KAG0448956.1 hypothetical protein HPP92_027598 [Vanilla planifolia]